MVNYNVLKAGGTSVGTPESMEKIIEETLHIHGQAICEDQDSVTILVVSATGKQETNYIRAKNTDLLEEILRGENVKANIEEIRRREQRVLPYFCLPEDFNNENFQLMQRYLSSGDISDEERRPLVATIVGERLKARQFESILNLRREDVAIFVDYDKSGVTTTGGFRNAKKTPHTYDDIRDALSKPEYKGKIVVLGGFMGIYEETNKVTILERGGSDTHAVWIASALGAKRAYIYSNTSLRRADPDIVPEADVIPWVTYGEMAEFIGFGAEILAYSANEAAEEALLELVLRNSHDLSQGETIISSSISDGHGGIKGVAASPSIVLALGNLPNIPGAYNQVTEVLNKYNIGFMNEAGDLRSSSMVLIDTPDNPLEENIGRVSKELADLGLSFKVLYNNTRIGLIGEDIGRQPRGLVALGETLGSQGLPINMISSPIDGIALSIITNQTYVPTVVRGLYNSLFKG